MHVINALAPVFILVAVGALLVRIKFTDELFFSGCAKLTYWIGLPCLLLYKISSAKFVFADSWKVFMTMTAASVIVVIIGSIASRFTPLNSDSRKTFVHTSFHCNTAFVGLPVIIYALGSTPQGKELSDIASVAVAPMIPAVHILSIIVMRGNNTFKGKGFLTTFLIKIFTNPMVLSCIAGIIISISGLCLPEAVNRGLSSLGRMALPLALLSIGAGLTFDRIKENFNSALLAAVFNVALLPFVGYFIARIWNLSNNETLLSLIFLACPTASSAYIYAKQLKGDHVLAGNVILLSTLISAASLWTVLFFFLR
jgi:predicted permease